LLLGWQEKNYFEDGLQAGAVTDFVLRISTGLNSLF
jgi:hypothetical protein